jgi:carboxymethylenebutenolidase
MLEKEIRVRTADGVMTAFVVRPDGDGPFHVAVIFMDGVGYREQLKANARRFAADGYYCVAPDLYYRFAMANLPVYNRDAAEHHFERTLDLWRRNLSPEPVKA